MLAKLHTFSLLGIDALPVEVEVDVSPDPSFTVHARDFLDLAAKLGA